MRLNDMGAAHVPHPEHQTQLPVPLTDHSVPAEQKGLGSFLRPGQLGENYPHHERLDHDSRDALQAEDEDCLRAFLGDGLVAVA